MIPPAPTESRKLSVGENGPFFSGGTHATHELAPEFRNPIVRYINRHLDVGGRIQVPLGSGLLSVVRQGTWHTFQLPKSVSLFLDAFHAGEFPQLEE
jgi:hypothetical protein